MELKSANEKAEATLEGSKVLRCQVELTKVKTKSSLRSKLRA